MKRLKSGIIAMLILSGAALANDNMTMPMGSATTTPAQQSYQNDMDKMHHDMMAGMHETDPDVAFAEGMIAHHQGAVDMARTQLKYGKDPEMRKLADAIIKAQQPEIDQMRNWLKQHKK